jgi:hypothetical protein
MFENNKPLQSGARLTSGLQQEVWDLADLVLKTRFVEALRDGATSYPIHRELRFAARVGLEALFDDLALRLGWQAQRLGTGRMILDADGLFISAHGGRKAAYCSCVFNIWAISTVAAEQAREAILAQVGAARITEPMFSIDWHFLASRGELESASIEEMADDVLFDQAYPELDGGVADFIGRYLRSPETVLVLQGPPGTGKTRLVRAILGEISRRNGGEAQALYTGDRKALESDEIFVKFITGWDDAFVVEDADHLLKARAAGNENLHRFLAIADGVVRAQARKIILSTNLPNLGDLDDALIRPGRCFARVFVRELTPAEATALMGELCAGQEEIGRSAMALLTAAGRNAYSLAEVYKVYGSARAGPVVPHGEVAAIGVVPAVLLPSPENV